MINWREPAVEDHSQQLELQTLTDTSFSSRKCKRHASLSVHSHFGLRARHCSLAFTAAYTIFQGASDELDCAPLAFVAVKEEISRYSSTGYRRSRSARLAPLHTCCAAVAASVVEALQHENTCDQVFERSQVECLWLLHSATPMQLLNQAEERGSISSMQVVELQRCA